MRLYCRITDLGALATNYKITDLHPLLDTDPDYPRRHSSGRAVNNSRQLVGGVDSGLNSGDAGVFYYENGNAQYLGTAGGETAGPYAINNSGQFVGSSQIDQSKIDFHAFLHNTSGWQDLGTLGGIHSSASGINDSGQIVGRSDIDISSSHQHAFLYDGGTMQDIGTLGGTNSSAADINNSGQIVGSSETGSGSVSHAFLYDGGTMQDLCVVTGCQNAGWDSLSSASAINDAGDIAGIGKINGQQHAFLYKDGVIKDIGAIAGGFYLAHVSDINVSGYVVGGGADAFLYDGTTMHKLCDLIDCPNAGWDSLDSAFWINDAGDITGMGVLGGNQHAFLLTAECVPGGIGLIGRCWRRWRYYWRRWLTCWRRCWCRR